MNRVAIAFSTKDRCELSRRSIEPLLQPDKFDLWVMDGSNTDAGIKFVNECCERTAPTCSVRFNVRGGADAAIVYALTTLLGEETDDFKFATSRPKYDYVGLVENDVLLTGLSWFDRAMALFEQGAADGLKVGAVSARCYEDRILIQRPDYAIMHNLGAGMVIFTREAAELVLKYFRTGWTYANRLLFSQLSGVDIGGYWAFRGGQHVLCADWSFDAVLAAHGLASLALTPSPVEMIGQVPPLAEQGLTLATGPVAERINDVAFQTYRDRLQAVREGQFKPVWPGLFHGEQGGVTVYPHQLRYLGGVYYGDWMLKWMMGFGPFAWKAGQEQEIILKPRSLGKSTSIAETTKLLPSFTVPILGPCDLFLGGGPSGGKVHIVDRQSGFEANPDLPSEGPDGQILALNVPASASYRTVEVTMLSPGTTFYGLKAREPQPYNPSLRFDHSWLPPTG